MTARHEEASTRPELRSFRSEQARQLEALLSDLPGLYPDAPEWLRKRCAEKEGITIAWADAQAVGAVILTVDDDNRMKISTLFVAPGFRRQGLGRELLTHAVTEFLSGSGSDLYITADESVSSQLFPLLQTYGFDIEERLSNRYRPGASEMVFAADRDAVLAAISAHNHHVYQQLADEYEQRTEALHDVTVAAVDGLTKFLPPQAELLDVGCGTGLATRLLLDRGYKMTAIEYSENMVAHARRRNPEAEIINGDYLATDLPRFQGMIALAFIHLFPRRQANEVLARMHSQLQPGGVLYTGTTDNQQSSEGLVLKADYSRPLPRWRRHWTREELEQAFSEAGFEILEAFPHSDPFGKKWLDYALLRP